MHEETSDESYLQVRYTNYYFYYREDRRNFNKITQKIKCNKLKLVANSTHEWIFHLHILTSQSDFEIYLRLFRVKLFDAFDMK